MKDFPLFTTQYGVASLILKEIPYRGEAYIRIQSTLDPELLLRECVDFCRVCGAERIYASGHAVLERYPLHTILYRMQGKTALHDGEIASLFPVTGQTVAKWRELYNSRMRHVDNASTLESRDEAGILKSGGAYFVHQAGELLGIGWLEGNRLTALASVKPGAGEAICNALQSLRPHEMLELEVASTNDKAIRLYEKLGFLKTGEISRWYCVSPVKETGETDTVKMSRKNA